MRKILLTLVMVAGGVSSVSSNVFLDIYGLYNYTGYAKAQTAPGVTSMAPGFLAGVNLTRDFSFIARWYKSSTVEDPNKDNEKNYSHMMIGGGFEYNYPIILRTMDFGFGWRSSVLFGGSRTEIKKKDPATLMNNTRDDSGLAFQITTGLQANLIPNIAVFADIGYHKSYYINDFSGKNISGYLAMAGVRLYMFNMKGIGDNY